MDPVATTSAHARSRKRWEFNDTTQSSHEPTERVLRPIKSQITMAYRMNSRSRFRHLIKPQAICLSKLKLAILNGFLRACQLNVRNSLVALKRLESNSTTILCAKPPMCLILTYHPLPYLPRHSEKRRQKKYWSRTRTQT